MKDRAQSTLDKLKNKSRTQNIAFGQLLQIVCQEEFLRRLSMSKYRNNFILKGGLFIYVISDFKSRTTIDIDFLMKDQSNKIDMVYNNIHEIIHTRTKNDFITFEIIKTEPITVENKYPGVSVRMVGKIKNTKTPVHIDVGVGDVVTPQPELRTMKPQLEDFGHVTICTYSLESAVAEKLDGLLKNQFLPSTWNAESQKWV